MIIGYLFLGSFLGLLSAAAALAAGYSLLAALAVYALAGAGGTLMLALTALVQPGPVPGNPQVAHD